MDFLAAARLDDRRAGVLGPSYRQGRLQDRGRADREIPDRRKLYQELPQGLQGRGHRHLSEQAIAQTGQDVSEAVGRLHAARPDAIVHCGFGFGLVQVNPALAALGWDPPRYMGTAFQNAWINQAMWQAIEGWVGLDQYDEGNLVGQNFLDAFEAEFGRRPEYCVPVVNRDLATVLLEAFADAHPLTPRGVKEALERVKCCPPHRGRPARGCHSENGPGAAGWAQGTWWRGGSIPTARIHIW
jgi:hypothetical protein